MGKAGISLYYIPMDDCHMSEYVADHFKAVEFVSGFTGSAARVLISPSEAFLFTDGRYYIQAQRQLKGSGIKLMKEGMPGVPGIFELAGELLKEGQALGFDGNVVSFSFVQKLKESIGKDIKIKADRDLAGEIWENRPEQVFTDIYGFDEKYCGESTASKIRRIREKTQRDLKGKEKNYLHIISSLDDLAWIFNIRAKDVECNPVAFAYGVIGKKEASLYIGGKMEEGLKERLESEGVTLGKYSPDCVCLNAPEGTAIVLGKDCTSYNTVRFYESRGYEIVDMENPSSLMKACKNETEIKNTKETYLKDSAALIRFMKWIKDLAAKTAPGEEIKENGRAVTELSADEKLQELRGENPGYMGPSFGTIAAYGPNGAMMHYAASKESFSVLRAEGMLLVDSGGQYRTGTTDITRTFVLGPLTEDEKKSFTLTAVSMLRLMRARFIKGSTGENVDIIAREPMWENGLDYKCGTGHGVGYVLNVHEGPHRIKWKITQERTAPLLEGMFVTDEPGVYKEGLYGIRLENELLVKPYMKTSDGEFLQFENMTFIPLDPDGIDKKYMTAEDVRLLEEYNAEVYEKISPCLDTETCEWLKDILGMRK